MATATQTASEVLRERGTEVNEMMRAGAERARSELEPMLRRADEMTRQFVAEYPLTALLGAVAAGYVLGRVLASSR